MCPGWETLVCLVQVVGVCIWKQGGPHSKATTAMPHVTATPTNSVSTLGGSMHSCLGLYNLTPQLAGTSLVPVGIAYTPGIL